MRTIKRLIEAKQIEREENGEAGFSLIELIIVVVILGILAVVAIPIIGGLQTSAKQAAADTAAANVATEVAADIAETGSGTASAPDGYTLVGDTTTFTTLGSVCIQVQDSNDDTITSKSTGPGC